MSSRDRVVVTGGAGFIGSALVARLVADGERVTTIDNLVNGRCGNVDPGARLVVADIRAPETYVDELRRAHTVFHLACLGVRHSLHSPRENHEVNATGTLALLEAARMAGVPRFVQVSSSEVYGSAPALPIDEDTPTRPTTGYGAAKLAGEAYARAYCTTYGLPVVILRPFNTYGPRCHHEGDAGEVIPKFLLRAMAERPLIVFGDGTQTRDFTFVDDIVAGLVAASRCDAAIGDTFNLGSGRAIRVIDLAERIKRVAGSRSPVCFEPPRPGDLPALCADSGRAARLFGFRPTTPLTQGLARLAEWYKTLPRPPEALLADEVIRNWEPAEVRRAG